MSLDDRFSALGRVYGGDALPLLQRARFCVVGIGGVGSWVAEALARSGVGHITLIDLDDIHASNINRQVHALSDTIGRSKVSVMRERILAINPDCDCVSIDDFISAKTLEQYIHGFDYVIDAIDGVAHKVALVAFCQRRKIPLVMTGGAGGLTDPLAIQMADLSKTFNDPLAAKVRATLRAQFGFSRNPKRRFGIDCIFSSEQQRYYKGDGVVSLAKPGKAGVTLDCEHGYGSSVMVTASFGLAAAARAINRYLQRATIKV